MPNLVGDSALLTRNMQKETLSACPEWLLAPHILGRESRRSERKRRSNNGKWRRSLQQLCQTLEHYRASTVAIA
jgi:hypothetical protein